MRPFVPPAVFLGRRRLLELVYHKRRLMGRVQRIPPEIALRVNVAAVGNSRFHGKMHELIVHQADDNLIFTGHSRVRRGVAQSFAIDRIPRFSRRGADDIAGVDI